MQLLRKLHLYVGLVVGLFLLVLSVTGGVLIFKDEIWAVRYAELRQPLAVLSDADHAEAFATIDQLFPQGVRLVRVPRAGRPAYHVYLEDGEALIGQKDHQLIRHWRWYETPMGIVTDLHFHLGAGNVGKIAGGLIGLVAAAMALTGFILWWPLRRQFGLRSLWLVNLRRATLLRLHRDLGTLAGAFILLFTLTAVGIVFYPAVRGTLNAIFSDRPVLTATPLPDTLSRQVPPPPAEAMRAARNSLPQARLISYSPPDGDSSLYYFRFKMPDEPHPNGRSEVYVRYPDEVLAHIDATMQPLGERMAQTIFPLHAARIGGTPYRAVALIAAVGLALLSLSGPVTYLQRRTRNRARLRTQATRSDPLRRHESRNS